MSSEHQPEDPTTIPCQPEDPAVIPCQPEDPATIQRQPEDPPTITCKPQDPPTIPCQSQEVPIFAIPVGLREPPVPPASSGIEPSDTCQLVIFLSEDTTAPKQANLSSTVLLKFADIEALASLDVLIPSAEGKVERCKPSSSFNADSTASAFPVTLQAACPGLAPSTLKFLRPVQLLQAWSQETFVCWIGHSWNLESCQCCPQPSKKELV